MMRRAINPSLAAQAMVIKVSANLVVQLVKRHTQTPPPAFDVQQIAEFALYGLLGSQVGNVIQFVLEDWFPTRSSTSSIHATNAASATGISLGTIPLKTSSLLGRAHAYDKGSPEDADGLLNDDDDDDDDGSDGRRKNSNAYQSSKIPLSPTTTSIARLEEASAPATLQGQDAVFYDDPVRPGSLADPGSNDSRAGSVRWRNVLAKLVLDQTIGLFISGTIFLVCTNFTRVAGPAMLVQVVHARIGALIKAGWHIWPLVAICNFLWVPVRSRVLVAVVVGFGWSIFLSIFASR